MLEILLNPNKSRNETYFEQVRKWAGEGCKGAYHSQKAISAWASVAVDSAKLVGMAVSDQLQNVKTIFKGTAAGLIMPYCTFLTLSIAKDLGVYQDAGKKELSIFENCTNSRLVDLFINVTDALSSYCYAAIPFVGGGKLGVVGQAFGASSDLAEAAKYAGKWSELSCADIQKTTKPVQNAIEQDKKFSMMCSAKAALSCGVAAISLVCLYFKIVLAAKAALAVTVAAAVAATLSCTNHFYKKNMDYDESNLADKLRNAAILV